MPATGSPRARCGRRARVCTFAPIVRYRSKTPYNAITGVDNNRDGFNFDLPADCALINCRRGSDFTQLDMRVSKRFRLGGNTAFELIAEGFNILNDTQPGDLRREHDARVSSASPRRFAGDFGQSEQRLFQLGVRFEF